MTPLNLSYNSGRNCGRTCSPSVSDMAVSRALPRMLFREFNRYAEVFGGAAVFLNDNSGYIVGKELYISEQQIELLQTKCVLIAEKEKQFVSYNRSAQVPAELVVAQWWFTLGECVARVELVILQKLKQHAMKLIGATLGDHVEDGWPTTKFSAEIVLNHSEFTHGAHRGNERRKIIATRQNHGPTVTVAEMLKERLPLTLRRPGSPPETLLCAVDVPAESTR